MDMRELRGLEIAARCRITVDNGVWSVPAQTGAGKYKITLKPGADACTCEDFGLTGKACKHIFAARIVRQRDHNGASVPLDTEVLPKKTTYKQNWPAYNEAQMTEKKRFLSLLFDLCRGIEEPSQPGRGRRRTTLGDMIFASAFKVYSTVSSRRFASDLEDAHQRGYLSNLMHSVSVCAYLENELMTPALHALIVRSSLPLKAIETTFAPDSSGFSTSRFVKWFDEKYGTERSGHAWVKCHLMTGVKTNIVSAVEIHGQDANDSPMFKPLMEATAQNFKIETVTADKGYLSHENYELAERMGATAYIPFKSNNVAGEAGTVWEKMFHYYQFRREEFLKHYHARSNVESTFSAIKAKFGDSVRSKTDVATKNEVLCKILCHNICVVHQSHIELGIEPVFWQEETKTESSDILKMPVRG